MYTCIFIIKYIFYKKLIYLCKCNIIHAKHAQFAKPLFQKLIVFTLTHSLGSLFSLRYCICNSLSSPSTAIKILQGPRKSLVKPAQKLSAQ